MNKNKKGELMNLEITTPAVMFPSVSLLLLAYTNRFWLLLLLSEEWIIALMMNFKWDKQQIYKETYELYKRMQYLGVSSLLFCVLTMLVIFF